MDQAVTVYEQLRDRSQLFDKADPALLIDPDADSPSPRLRYGDGIRPVRRDMIDHSDLAITLRVNDEVVSEGSTRNMIFSVETIVSYISQFMTLNPGDLVFTGTPMGSLIELGNSVEVRIEGIGTLQNQVADKRA